jgi:dTDP-4-amino-4,6-dideoxygalactose transaminase
LSISNAKLKPILVEPDIHSFNINPAKIESKITTRTKAILGVHLYGQLYDVIALERLCKTNDLILIEDAAQAHGAISVDGRKAGNVSDVAAFSFYPTKNLGALGDAGAITTNNSKLAKVILKLRNYGRVSSSLNDIKGFNCRLDELQAAFLRVKLKYLDADNNKRRLIAQKYINKIGSELITVPKYDVIDEHVFHLFVIKSAYRDGIRKYLFENEVETMIHYPKAIHKQNAYKEFGELNLPITSKLHGEILSIPMHQNLEEIEIERIIYLLSNFNQSPRHK